MTEALYDGMHVTEGDYKGYRIGDLEDAPLVYTRELAAQRLNEIENGTGVCHTRKYRGDDWSYVQQVDFGYWSWILSRQRAHVAVFDAEIQRRERARQSAEKRREQEQAAGEVFDDREQHEIRDKRLIDAWERHWLAGWRSEVKSAHPDAGGNHESMLALNLEKRLFEKVIDALRTELGDAKSLQKGK